MQPTPAGYEIHGYAVVSDDDAIADESGATPRALRHEADWRYFQEALARAAVVVLGRLGHEANPNPARRTRLVLSSRIARLERSADGWVWNPAGAQLAAALAAAAPGGGLVAVVGGQAVFDLFLGQGYDAFHLTRIPGVRVPGGRKVFAACAAEGVSAESVLAGSGLVNDPVRPLDDAGRVLLGLWRRTGGLPGSP